MRSLPQAEFCLMAVSLKVNGAVHSVTAEPDTPLLYVLRNDLGLNAAKFGCGLGQCGACTVLVAAQCGYCIPGMIMFAKVLLDRIQQPSEAEVRLGLAGNLCRCGAHNRIVRAVLKAAQAGGRI
jgi:nicotinate dehydrogenase subunit A